MSEPNQFRSSLFFTDDVAEAVDYVLDQSEQYRDKQLFVGAVIQKLKPFRDEIPSPRTAPGKSTPPGPRKGVKP